MSKIKFDTEAVAVVMMEIAARFKTILNLFPKEMGEDEILLRHLAATSIHAAFFTRDIYNYLESKPMETEDYEKEFVNRCGCDFNKETKQ